MLPADYNPRTISDRALQGLSASIERFGLVQPIVWNKRSGKVVGGHQRLKVLAEKGVTEADVVEVDLSPEEEIALNVTLNNPEIQGDWNEKKLEEILTSLMGQSKDLFEALQMEDLADGLEMSLNDKPNKATDAEPRMDEAEKLREQWGVETGQIWRMGEHLLACGDCRDASMYERLLQGQRAQLAVTSPPYGVGKSYEEAGLQPWMDTVKPCIQNLCKHVEVVVWQLGDLYATGSQFIEPTMAYSIQMFMECGHRPIWIRIWEKQGLNFGGNQPYWLVSTKPVQQYEQIVALSSKDGSTEEGQLVDYEWITAFAGSQYKYLRRLTKKDRKEWGYSGIWKINTVRENDKHPAMFPLELPRRCILMHSDEGGLVFEPFNGAGTTMMACENTGRKCRSIEILPRFVAVTLQRWTDATGVKPTLEAK